MIDLGAWGADIGDLRVYMDGETARWSGGPGMTPDEVRRAVERRIAEQKLQTHALETWLRRWSEQEER